MNWLRRLPPWALFLTLVLALLVPAVWLGRHSGLFRQPLDGQHGALSCPALCQRYSFVVFGHAIRPDLYVPLVVLGVIVFVTQHIARTSAVGTIAVAEVVDATHATSHSSLADQVRAILHDRLARSGVQPRGLLPTYTGIDTGAEEPVSSSPLAVSGFVARLGVGLWRSSMHRLGWTVSATIRTAEGTGQAGITFVVEHVATRRHDLVETIWAPTVQEAARQAAYHISAWHQQRLTPPSSRTRPRWRPTPTSLRYLGDSVFFLSRRRFDEAIDAARKGLAEDPTNLAVRRVLGEAYERLGQFLSALDVYAYGIVQLLDLANNWGVGKDEGRADRAWRWPYYDMPRDRVARWWRRATGRPARRQRPIASVEAVEVLWRYVAVLTFSDQWVNRWITDLMRRQVRLRTARWRAHHDGRPQPKDRWVSTTLSDDELLCGLSTEDDAVERAQRHEMAKRLRGYLKKRYAEVLAEEFPLLLQAWFDEDGPGGGPFRLGTPPNPGPGGGRRPRDWLRVEAERFPLLERARRARVRPGGPWNLSMVDWVGELRWLFTLLDGYDSPASRAGEQVGVGTVPRSILELLNEARLRLGLTGTETFGQVAEALTSQPEWDAMRLERILVGEVATWAAHHLTELAARDPLLAEELAPQRYRLQRLRAQLDVRLFLRRAALEDLARLARKEEIAGRWPDMRRYRRLVRLKARLSYFERMWEIIDPSLGADPEAAAGLAALREQTVRQARRLTRRSSRPWHWAWGRRLVRFRPSWNLYYYAACVIASVMPEPREPEDTANGFGAPPLEEWKASNDETAMLAVRALNNSLLVRRRGEHAGLDVGALDWLLYEDPDLERLRLHPRFERWASGTLATTVESQDESRVDEWMRVDRLQGRENKTSGLRSREWRNEGVYGRARRWVRSTRLWWLANDHYLIESIVDFAPKIADQWRKLAQEVRSSGPEDARAVAPVLLGQLARRSEEDDAAWRVLAGYRRFGSRPDLRIKAARQLARLSGTNVLPRSFPTTREVLTHALVLDYDRVDRLLSPLVQLAIDAQGELRATVAVAHERLADVLAVRPDGPVGAEDPPALTRAQAEGIALAAARRWHRLCVDLTELTEWKRDTNVYAREHPWLERYLLRAE